MIRSYRDRKTQRFADGHRVPQFEPFRRQAERRLRVLEAAMSLLDLRTLPSNRLEALKGDRQGQYSIRINDQWRICFEWRPGAEETAVASAEVVAIRRPRGCRAEAAIGSAV